MKQFKLVLITFSTLLLMSFSLSEKKSSVSSESCEETVTVIYEHETSCGGFHGFYYIQNGNGICGNNYFQTLKVPCKDLIPFPGHPY